MWKKKSPSILYSFGLFSFRLTASSSIFPALVWVQLQSVFAHTCKNLQKSVKVYLGNILFLCRLNLLNQFQSALLLLVLLATVMAVISHTFCLTPIFRNANLLYFCKCGPCSSEMRGEGLQLHHPNQHDFKAFLRASDSKKDG